MGNPEKRVTIKEEPDSKAVENAPWDAEEDHLLSYFLADGSQQQSAARHGYARHSADPNIAPNAVASSESDTATSTAADEAPDSAPASLPPTTPAVHFYSAPPKDPSSSKPRSDSLSMTSMAAALVHGVPVLPPSGSSESKEKDLTSDSPISPAATIGTGQENLMLPPPNLTEAEKQQHLAWLQQINAMAAVARQPGAQPSPVHSSVAALQQPGMAPPMPPPPGYIPPHSMPVYQAQQQQPPQPSQAETEERRARRLARNRESARQSRRRKKERLNTLERKVHTLFGQVESERRRKIMEMEACIQQNYQERLSRMDEGKVTRDDLETLLKETGPNCMIRERVASFQYDKLRQFLLPRSEEFLLWLTLQSDSFFTEAKGLREKAGNRLSSKQIGEEITNEFKRIQKEEGADANKPANLTSSAHDAVRMWPLMCYELAVSVDQEERLLQTQKRTRDIPTLPEERMKMALATKMATNMRKGVLFQGHAASMRTGTTLLEILTPEQSVKFLKWMSTHRNDCSEMIRRHTEADDAVMRNETQTLSDLCKVLEEVLRLPKESGE